jgi:hypothetical protein
MVRIALGCGQPRCNGRHQGLLVLLVAPVIFLSLFTGTHAQNASDAQRRDDSGWFRHIRTTDPGHPDGPLRQENISDNEVREIQQAALEVYPDFIVNISGVTNGCNCEEGSKCTAQVWIGLYRDDQTRSLVLSKINDHWEIGAVQRWWLHYSAHQVTNPGFGRGPKQIAWSEENQRLLDSFPACPIAPVDWMLVRNSTFVDMSSFKVSGFIRHANFKRVFPPPPKKYDWPTVLFTISSIAFDCKDHRTQINWWDTYDDDGRAYGGSGWHQDSVLWYPIRPKTDSAADWDLICGWNGK